MYENYLYLPWFNEIHSWTPMTLDEGMKNRKGHLYYGKVCHVDKEGYFDERHENPQYNAYGTLYKHKDRKFYFYRVCDEVRRHTGQMGVVDGIKAFINKDDLNEYIVVKCVKRGSNTEDAFRKMGFTVLKVCHD